MSQVAEKSLSATKGSEAVEWIKNEDYDNTGEGKRVHVRCCGIVRRPSVPLWLCRWSLGRVANHGGGGASYQGPLHTQATAFQGGCPWCR